MKTIAHSALLLAGAAMFSTAATAQQQAGPGVAPGGHNAARAMLVARIAADLTPRQIATLNVVAHATAAATACPRLSLNDAAVVSAVSSVIGAGGPGLRSEADRDSFKSRVLVGFGSLVGITVDEAADTPDAFCAQAEADMQKDAARSFLRLTR